jgi:hypothetical protein
MMVVHPTSRIVNHGNLYHGIKNDWGLQDVLEFFLVLAMGKAPMMG